MTNQQHTDDVTNHRNDAKKEHRGDAGVTDLLGSMVGLATAGTKFTIEQMQNAVALFTDSQSAMNRVRNSLDNLSNAMAGQTTETQGTRKRESASEPQAAADTFTGRKV